MSNLVVYNLAGHLLRLIEGTEPPADEVLQPGEVAVRDVPDPWRTYYAAGAVHTYTPEQMAQKASPPGYPAQWSNATMAWEDLRTLLDMKAAKNAAINEARLRANRTHFMFQGKQIRTDEASFMDIMGAHGDWVTGQTPANWPGGWKAVDNSYVAIPDQATWMAFYRSMVAQGTANFVHAQALKAQLDAATTPAEVDAVPSW